MNDRERATIPLLLTLLLLSACNEVELGPHPYYHEGPPPGRLLPKVEVFYELPGCVGEGFIAGGGEVFAYQSVLADECVDESGEGFGP